MLAIGLADADCIRNWRVKTYHDISVLGRALARSIELEAVLNLLTESITELGRGFLREVIDTAGHGALVGEVSGNAALVLDTSPTNEAAVVDQTVLGSIALGLEGTEKSLFGTENLQSGSGVFGKVGERASVRDEASSNRRANQGLQVGSNMAHLLLKVARGGLAVGSLLDNGLGKLGDDFQIGRHNIKTHGDLCGVYDGLGLLTVFANNSCNVVQLLVAQRLLVANGENQLSIGEVVGNNLDQLGEVPAVPFTDAHEELVHTLVLEIEGSTSLDNVVVVLGDAELDLGTGVGVTHTKTSLFNVASLEVAQKLVGVQTNAADDVGDDFRGVGSLVVQSGEFALDGTSKVSLGDTQDNLGLFAARFGEVEFEDGLEIVGADAFGNQVDIFKSFDVAAVERRAC